MAENEHDENLIDDIMRGGPNYCLDRIESLETEVSRLQLDDEEHAVALDYILSDIAWLHEYLDTAEFPVSTQFVLGKLDEMFECDIEGDKKYGKALADIRGEPQRPRLLELVRAFDENTALRVRVAELEVAIRAIVSAYDSFEASSIENADVSTMLALTGTVQAIGRAEAILGVRSQSAPEEGEDGNEN